MGLSKYRGSAIYALSMFIHNPNYAHRIPNVNLGLYSGGGVIWKDIWVSLQGAYFQRAYLQDFRISVLFTYYIQCFAR